MKRLMWPLLAVLLICANVSAQFISVPYRPRVDVTKYGAKKDSTSGAATIYAFHRALAVAQDTGVVYVPAGKYLLDSTFVINVNNASIELDEGAYLYFPVEAQNAWLRNGIVFDSVSNVTWHGGNIFGDADSSALVANNQARANGMLLWSTTRCKVSGVKVRGFEYGIKILGISSSTVQSTYNTVEDCEVRYNQRDNIILTNASYNTVRNNVLYEAGYIDYGVDDSAYGSWDVNSGDVGSGVALRNFDFTGSEDTSWFNVITGNEIYNCRGHGVLIWREDSTVEDNRYTTVSYNVIHDVRYHGVQVADAPYTTVEGNKIWNTNRPNNWLGNVYIEATFNNSGINLELRSHFSKIIGNICFDTKVFDTLTPDEAMMFSGVNCGDGAPKVAAGTESTVEPAPDSVSIYGNSFSNTKRYQKAMIQNGGGYYYTDSGIDGYVVNGIPPSDTLYRTDNLIYRDGRDNISIDSFSFATAQLYNNSWSGASPLYMVGRFPLTGTATSGWVPKLTVSGGDTTLAWATDATAAAGSGIDSATAGVIVRDTGAILYAPIGATKDSFYVAESLATSPGWKQSGDTVFVDTSGGGGLDESAVNALITDSLDEYTLTSAMQNYVPLQIEDSLDEYSTTALMLAAISDSLDVALRLLGGTMQADFSMGGFDITNIGSLIADQLAFSAGQTTHISSADSIKIAASAGNDLKLQTASGGDITFWDGLSPSLRFTISNNRLTGNTNSAVVTDSLIAGGQIIAADADIASEAEVATIIDNTIDLDSTNFATQSVPVAQIDQTTGKLWISGNEVDSSSVFAGTTPDSSFVTTYTDTIRPYTLSNDSGAIVIGKSTDTIRFGAKQLFFAGDTLSLALQVLTDYLNADTLLFGGVQLPTSDGTNGQILQTNGSGVMSWTSNSAGLTASNVTDSLNGRIPDSATVQLFNPTGRWRFENATVGRGYASDSGVTDSNFVTAGFVSSTYAALAGFTIGGDITMLSHNIDFSTVGGQITSVDYISTDSILVGSELLTGDASILSEAEASATYETITNVAEIGDDTANFKTAYGWGDHSTQNYYDKDDANVGELYKYFRHVYFDTLGHNDSIGVVFGATAGTIAEGDHLHTGVYEPIGRKKNYNMALVFVDRSSTDSATVELPRIIGDTLYIARDSSYDASGQDNSIAFAWVADDSCQVDSILLFTDIDAAAVDSFITYVPRTGNKWADSQAVATNINITASTITETQLDGGQEVLARGEQFAVRFRLDMDAAADLAEVLMVQVVTTPLR